MAICAGTDNYPGSNYVDILLHNFGTDDWMPAFITYLTLGSSEESQMLSAARFQGKKNFHVDKLASQVQSLLLKLIEIATAEASFLMPSFKALFTREGDESTNKDEHTARYDAMFQNHLRREVMHVLFSQGANTSIDQIKKASQSCYLKTDVYTQTVLAMSTQNTDVTGKKSFRLA